jgi:hypothetical protein
LSTQLSTNEATVSYRKVKTSSDRSFGRVFALAFAVVALWPLASGAPMRLWAAIVAACFLGVSIAAPRLLNPLNRAWARLGLLMGRILSPVVMAVVYSIIIVPAGLLLRVLGRDPLRLKWQPQAETYWIAREQPAPEPDSMSRQF